MTALERAIAQARAALAGEIPVSAGVLILVPADALQALVAAHGDLGGDVGRTDDEIVDQTEQVAQRLMAWFFRQHVAPGTSLRHSENPRARSCWDMAVELQDLLTQSDAQSAADVVDGSLARQHS
ncbi:hypothetical protein [Acidovorax sp. BLS4]|uniref:hypothetical protein n=1 Tax=Acidovorax sp. BLS4 TaxID=3273430 RepID=UPI0029422934|nr:hypothetical protein [Paracidovorax avenae]WOI47010.1 hypothetical protein R1Z03_07295 [Paracidovorax avenae]